MKLMNLIICFGVLSCTLSCVENTTSPPEDTEKIISKVKFEKPDAPVFHTSHEPKKQDAPFSDAVQAGNIFYLSGQIGMDHTVRELVEGGIEAETKQALENIKAVLAHHNVPMDHVVKVTVILENMEDFPAFNAIYTHYFPQKPARTTFAAKGLAKGAKIEIEVVAVRPSSEN